MAMWAEVSHFGNLLQPPVGSNIETALGGAGIQKYVIPAYQRPYDWERKHFEQFVGGRGLGEHLENNWGNPVDYFVGHIVVFRDAHQPRPEIVDGQQRFTALTIIAAALRDECFRNNKYSMGWEIHRSLISGNGGFRFESSAYSGGQENDQQLMMLIQSIPSNDQRGNGIGTYRYYPVDLEFEVTMVNDWIAPAGGGQQADISSSSNAINFPILAGTMLDFGGGLVATVQGPPGGGIAVPAQDAFPLANPLILSCANDIPAGSTATVSLAVNGGIRTDLALDANWPAAGVPGGVPIGNVNMNRHFWTHYKLAVDEIRRTLALPLGITLTSWKDLLMDHIVLTVARSDDNREAQEYFRLLNDDRFKKTLTLADIWRAEVISDVTSRAQLDISRIRGGARPPAADPIGIDGGQGVGFITGLEGEIHELLVEITDRLRLPPRRGRDDTQKVGEFLEHFCLSCGVRAPGTKALDEIEKFRNLLYNERVIASGNPLTSGLPVVSPPPVARRVFLPEDPANADIRIHWLAYRDSMNELNRRSQVYREIILPANGDPFRTRLMNLSKTSHKQYIPLLLVGLTKIRRAAEIAGIPRVPSDAIPTPTRRQIRDWAPYSTEEERIVSMVEYLVVRGTILPSPNNGALSSGAVYREMETWCAAIDQCDYTITNISNILRYISGSAQAPLLAAIGPGPYVAGTAAMPVAPPIAVGALSAYGTNHVRLRRKTRWSTNAAGNFAAAINVQFETIFGLCNGLTWAAGGVLAGPIDPIFWTSADYQYPDAAECRMLLWKIEVYLRQTVVGFAVAGDLDFGVRDDRDVEHILPQTLSPVWVAALGGANQSDWLDRLGNKGLYERGANGAIGNSSFADKQTNNPHGYNYKTGRWFHMHDLTNPKAASPLLLPGGGFTVPHDNGVAPPGAGIYGANWGPAQIETRSEWLFGLLWEIFNPIP